MFSDSGVEMAKTALCRQTISERKRWKAVDFELVESLPDRKTVLPSKSHRKPYCALAENMIQYQSTSRPKGN
jgi:hypothetical protein